MNESPIQLYDRKHVWHPFTQMQTAPDPLVIVSAKDAELISEEGKVYLDANSSWWVNTHGHGNEHIASVIKEQLSELDHVLFAGVTHPRAVELATRLVQLFPEPLNKVFYSDNGSTAVEVALKMAIQFWHNRGIKRKKIVALDGAYHGDTFGAMAVGQRAYFNAPFEDYFFEVSYLPFPAFAAEHAALEQAKNLFEGGEVAALIVEPIVQGSAGMRMYRPEWLDALCALARKHEVLIIFDEIMTGWGRTGKLFAMNYLQQQPDLVCLSKGLTGGVLPMGVTMASDAIYEAFLSDDKAKALLHGHSYTASAMACAAACANLDLIGEELFYEQIERVAVQHRDFYHQVRNHPLVADVRQAGTILAIELKQDEGSHYFSSIRDIIYQHFLDQGILLRPLGNVVFLNPPYCTSNEQLGKMYQAILDLLDQLTTR